MAGEWETKRIGDLGRVVTGKTPSTAVAENFGGNYPFITIPDMDGRREISTSARTLSEQGAQSLRTCRLPAGAVMMSCIATIGNCGITTRPSFTNQQINSLICGDDADPKFVYYCFTQLGHALEAAGGGGSVYTNVSKSRFEEIELTLPPLAEQKAIAAVLGALDDKIECNRRINATLEAMAWALFQSWFVDFDPVRAKLDGRPPAALDPATAALFPASFQDSALGPIPHGWRAAHLEEIASVGSGKRPEGRCDVLSPECNIPLYGGGGRMGYVPSALYDKPILFTGRVGTLGLIFRTAEPSWPSDNTLIVEPQAGLFDFTYFVLKGFDLVTLNRGSTQPLLTQTDLKRQTFVLPTKDVVKAFADVSAPIFRHMVSNERESRTLATLRDTLLPKLLSGELSVADMKKNLP
jgi:type I restriction enzyme S subunit